MQWLHDGSPSHVDQGPARHWKLLTLLLTRGRTSLHSGAGSSTPPSVQPDRCDPSGRASCISVNGEWQSRHQRRCLPGPRPRVDHQTRQRQAQNATTAPRKPRGHMSMGVTPSSPSCREPAMIRPIMRMGPMIAANRLRRHEAWSFAAARISGVSGDESEAQTATRRFTHPTIRAGGAREPTSPATRPVLSC